MIPKIIHYCWFGRGEKPKLAKKCIASWKKYCPDYEIIEWNEDNFDVNAFDYTRFTYERKLYAYLSDFVRLWAVEKHGGFYFDTDVELLCSLDTYLDKQAFFGFEGAMFVNTGIGFGAEPNQEAVQKMLSRYQARTTDILSKQYATEGVLRGSPKMNTYAMTPYGLKQNGLYQTVCGAEFLPTDYMCPFNDLTGELKLTDNTISIHWYMKSANSKMAKLRSKISRPLHRIMNFLQRRKGVVNDT